MLDYKNILKLAAAVGLISFSYRFAAGLAEILVEYPIWRGIIGGY